MNKIIKELVSTALVVSMTASFITGCNSNDNMEETEFPMDESLTESIILTEANINNVKSFFIITPSLHFYDFSSIACLSSRWHEGRTKDFPPHYGPEAIGNLGTRYQSYGVDQESANA